MGSNASDEVRMVLLNAAVSQTSPPEHVPCVSIVIRGRILRSRSVAGETTLFEADCQACRSCNTMAKDPRLTQGPSLFLVDPSQTSDALSPSRDIFSDYECSNAVSEDGENGSCSDAALSNPNRKRKLQRQTTMSLNLSIIVPSSNDRTILGDANCTEKEATTQALNVSPVSVAECPCTPRTTRTEFLTLSAALGGIKLPITCATPSSDCSTDAKSTYSDGAGANTDTESPASPRSPSVGPMKRTRTLSPRTTQHSTAQYNTQPSVSTFHSLLAASQSQHTSQNTQYARNTQYTQYTQNVPASQCRNNTKMIRIVDIPIGATDRAYLQYSRNTTHVVISDCMNIKSRKLLYHSTASFYYMSKQRNLTVLADTRVKKSVAVGQSWLGKILISSSTPLHHIALCEEVLVRKECLWCEDEFRMLTPDKFSRCFLDSVGIDDKMLQDKLLALHWAVRGGSECAV